MRLKRLNAGLLSNILRVLSANFWVAIVGLVSSLLFPKILTIDDYALYHTFMLYLSYITILHLGFPSGMVINYAGKRYEDIDAAQYKAEIRLLEIFLFVFTVIFAVLSYLSGNKMLIYISFAIIPFCFISSYRSLLQAWSRFKEYSVISIATATFVPVGGLLFYIIYGDLPGDIYVYIYLFTYWLIFLFIYWEVKNKTKGIEAGALISKRNWETEKVGIIITLGNYINVLFASADKQFVKWFFDVPQFAFYSFGISMRALMTVFVTSISQPLFPTMAQGKIKDEDYNGVKEVLFIFGSFSGLAYYVVSIIVKYFISKYTESLEVVSIYFAVFPAMAVVNCLYVNLYKIKNKVKQYVRTLIGILSLAVLLNFMFVFWYPDYTGVAIATTISYYVWLLIGTWQFKFIHLRVNDIGYLIVFIVGYFYIIKKMSDVYGFICYFLFIVVIACLFYKERIVMLLKRVIKSPI